MAGNGNDSLIQSHFDDDILEEYVLDQLLPAEAEAVRRHLVTCLECRTKVAEIQAMCRHIEISLHQTLDETRPGPRLSFDSIEAGWREPPRRVSMLYRVRQFVPNAVSVVLIPLVALVLLLLVPSSGSASLRSLELIEDYHGPDAVVAVATEDGLVVVRLEDNQTRVALHLPHLTDPANLQISPDGQWLALQQSNTLHIIQTTENNCHIRITIRDMADWAWSPNGQTLAYTNGVGQLALFDVLTQTNRAIIPAEEHAWGQPVWSADGEQIAYAVVEPLPTYGEQPVRQGIWRVTTANGYHVELARNPTPKDTLLLPEAWSSNGLLLLTWDVNAGTTGQQPTLYRINAADHEIEPIDGTSLAQGTRLAWPVSSQDITLATRDNRLVALRLSSDSFQLVPDQIPWPRMIAWAPNGAWMAFTVVGAADGSGLYVYALDEAELRSIKLPGGATEKAVFWAGPENLFVIRQPQNRMAAELWCVSLTTDDAPQRILTNARLPQTGPNAGWRWEDILAMQVLDAPTE